MIRRAMPLPSPGFVLRRGAAGQEVKRLQSALNDHHGTHLVADGRFGPKTEAVVRDFQLRSDIAGDPLGTAGPAVLQALGCEVYAGIDVSRYQGNINWHRASKDPQGIRFVIIKASQKSKAERLDEYRAGAHSVGLGVGFYHFWKPTRSPEREVATFMDAVGELRADEFRPILDVEDRTFGKPALMLERVIETVRLLEQETGRRPVIYTSNGIIKGHLAGAVGLPALADLWTCEYVSGVDPGDVLSPWSEWLLWQYTSRGHADGVPSKGLDMDWMAGGALERLLAA